MASDGGAKSRRTASAAVRLAQRVSAALSRSRLGTDHTDRRHAAADQRVEGRERGRRPARAAGDQDDGEQTSRDAHGTSLPDPVAAGPGHRVVVTETGALPAGTGALTAVSPPVAASISNTERLPVVGLAT